MVKNARRLGVSNSDYLRRLIKQGTRPSKEEAVNHATSLNGSELEKLYRDGEFSRVIAILEHDATKEFGQLVMLASSYMFAGRFGDALRIIKYARHNAADQSEMMRLEMLTMEIALNTFDKRLAEETLLTLHAYDDINDRDAQAFKHLLMAKHSMYKNKLKQSQEHLDNGLELAGSNNEHVLIKAILLYWQYDLALRSQAPNHLPDSRHRTIKELELLSTATKHQFIQGLHHYACGRQALYIALDPELAKDHLARARKLFALCGASYYAYDIATDYAFAVATTDGADAHEQIISDALKLEKEFGYKVWFNKVHSHKAIIEARKGNARALSGLMKRSEALGIGHFAEVYGPIVGSRYLFAKTPFERGAAKAALLAMVTLNPKSPRANIVRSVLKHKDVVVKKT